MGLVSHEAPHLTSKGPVPYPATDEDLPLESGMVISIETAILHPKRGFIKLEDTVAVTESGWEGFGDNCRSYNKARQSTRNDKSSTANLERKQASNSITPEDCRIAS